MRHEIQTIDRPVFVIGTGRCGLTPLMHAIALHESFGWPSQFNDRFPSALALAGLSRLSDWRIFHGAIRFQWYFPRHTETYRLWDRVYLGFRAPFRDLVADDVTPLVATRFRNTAARILAAQHKKRFITEYSGWSRIGFIRAIFPDARFIHIVRDGRAVANSLTNIPYWEGWGGVTRWRWGALSPDQHASLAKHRDSFLAIAAMQWKIVVRNIADNCAALPADQTLTIRYEDLSNDHADVARQCLAFCGLADSARFRRHLSTVRIGNANTTAFRIPPWRQNMSDADVDMLTEILGEELQNFGYA
jgi:hypothetical protein